MLAARRSTSKYLVLMSTYRYFERAMLTSRTCRVAHPQALRRQPSRLELRSDTYCYLKPGPPRSLSAQTSTMVTPMLLFAAPLYKLTSSHDFVHPSTTPQTLLSDTSHSPTAKPTTYSSMDNFDSLSLGLELDFEPAELFPQQIPAAELESPIPIDLERQDAVIHGAGCVIA
ncbi:uncharacterized protein EV420DRAFT_1561621 [Desarmillaria tabescens]|uniref:Uncharacterized protein n=1 Tax=Armillaria tabescens TaxID=1929756 RepID=A0AA39K152_ARMTA|nr:uncharacterized protein EV420DRAFT_1561621 [Desarmillaria tabescens]KAK0451239.1 hypothetical protein EV420DRAFT_1561621 [Desarmillaria tabescens]